VTAGDVVGELAVLSGHPRNATVVAETEVRVLVLTHRGLDQLLDDIPGLAKHMLHEVTARMMEGSSRGQEFEVLVDVNLGFLYFHTVE
jgi:CRP-like cAMP-binding protein